MESETATESVPAKESISESLDAPLSEKVNITLEFGGGMELLFNKERRHSVSLPSTMADGKSTNVAYLIPWIRDNLLKGRVELFMEGRTVRPGILVLINDIDWELEDEVEYVLKDGDDIVFISTLHGG